MFELNAFAREVHQNAVEHGWWEKERGEHTIAILSPFFNINHTFSLSHNALVYFYYYSLFSPILSHTTNSNKSNSNLTLPCSTT